MKREDRAQRNAAICEMYRGGASLREVADAHRLTAEGVRQILKRCGEPIRDNAAAVKANWQDPEFRARNAAATKANWQDPEFRAKQAAATKANWQDPEFRARNAAAVKANWQDPEFRAKQAAATKAAKSVWPDCPANLAEDYETLRHYMSARDARAALDPDFARGEAA